MMQSRRMSFVEAVTNVAIGYGVAVGTQILVFPLFGFDPGVGDNLIIGAIFTGVSLIRSYTLRRAFERWRIGRLAPPAVRSLARLTQNSTLASLD